MRGRFLLAKFLLLSVAACSSSDGGGAAAAPEKPAKAKPTALAPLTDVASTVSVTFVPQKPRQNSKDGPDPALSNDILADYLQRGFGDLATGAGQPYVARVIDNGVAPAPGPAAKRILRFVHLSDLQIADDESPARLALFDSPDLTSGAARPEDPQLCRMTNAAVRTINALHAKDPIAFTLLGGDNADSAQQNELDWVLGMLSGASEVECDSGDDDDITPGPDNDGKDPFVAAGLAMPWKWVTGNHDVLVQGNFAIVDALRQNAIGNNSASGTRDYKQNGVVASGDFVVEDARRALLSRQDLMTRVAGDKDGHGIGGGETTSGRATYSFDADGTPFRFIVVDTAHEAGGAEGVIRQSEVDRVIKPLLDKAKADGKLVILASHHSATNLTPDGGTFGSKEPDALTEGQWATLIGQYDNVLFSMVGHSHRNRVRAVSPAAGHAWWEVMTAAIADFPHQFRVVEIFDQDNGYMMMRATNYDFGIEGDPIAAEGRRRGTVDLTSGWEQADGTGQAVDRNVELWIRKP